MKELIEMTKLEIGSQNISVASSNHVQSRCRASTTGVLVMSALSPSLPSSWHWSLLRGCVGALVSPCPSFLRNFLFLRVI